MPEQPAISRTEEQKATFYIYINRCKEITGLPFCSSAYVQSLFLSLHIFQYVPRLAVQRPADCL